MIKPFGSDKLNPLYVADDAKRKALLNEAEGLPSVVISSAAAGNAVMLGSGYFNPLRGYMKVADAVSVAEKMQTTSGLFWPTPVLNVLKDASAIKGAKRIALRDPNVEGNFGHHVRTPGGGKVQDPLVDRLPFLGCRGYRTGRLGSQNEAPSAGFFDPLGQVHQTY